MVVCDYAKLSSAKVNQKWARIYQYEHTKKKKQVNFGLDFSVFAITNTRSPFGMALDFSRIFVFLVDPMRVRTCIQLA